jgi:formate hydrogenlyase subunit 3/multisubunit Na+/H+ antiporter MnhD subunit
MKRHHVSATASLCLTGFPPLVGFYPPWHGLATLIPNDPVTAFLVGCVIGFCFAMPTILFAISISSGEKS